MEWNQHKDLDGSHALLSPSSYHWLNYDPDKMRVIYNNQMSKHKGTFDHDLASRLIQSGTRVRHQKKAFNLFVNDCIREGMSSEVLLYYSRNCFGTADGIKFEEETNTLRIYDLKTGTGKTKFDQLYIYAALFCLEYDKDPMQLEMILRLYQFNSYRQELADRERVKGAMQQIVTMDRVVEGEFSENRNKMYWRY